ncbi:transcription factor HHO2-like [Magnolia sinica]|uniref:transcription factor HHO2-like n=1 Tax=Magnolia sinica TaxID=86752 RepID=UPI002659DDB0|nr:transcription factor HHO2-like [Magnolia sinica]
MGSSSGLSLGFEPSFTTKTIVGFLREVSSMGDFGKKLSKLEEYVKCLEEERRKIDVFKRELPLCMILLNDAIEAMKKEEKQCRSENENDRPILEEFMPVRSKIGEDGGLKMEKDGGDKMNWMSSAQLWSNNNSPDNDNNHNNKKNQLTDMKKKEKEHNQTIDKNLFPGCNYKSGGGAFMPFKGLSGSLVSRRKAEEAAVPAPNLSLFSSEIKSPNVESGGGSLNSKSSGKDMVSPSATAQSNSQPPRKARRCWSPELHRRFVSALQQLGGSQVATPKQIRELMKVDGLTNDEVKSHLQKYRLHTRRLPAAGAAVTNQQVAMMGGVWVPRNNYHSSKPITSQSNSPQGPLQLAGAARAISATGGDSGEDEDEKSESYGWRGHLQRSVDENTE